MADGQGGGQQQGGQQQGGQQQGGQQQGGQQQSGQQQSGEFSWASAGLEADALQHVQAKGFKNVNDLARSYISAEKLIGVSPDQIVKLPKADAADAEWAPVWDRLGRPKLAAEYKLPVPEGDDGKFAGTASAWFHEAGVPAKMAQKVVAKWNEHVAGLVKAQADEAKQRVAADQAALKNEWGAAHDSNVAIARRVAPAFGVKGETIDKIQSALGFAETMKLFHAIGVKIAVDDPFVPGDGGNRNFGGGYTADTAKARIAALQGDKEWVKKYVAGGTGERAEMARLHQIAYPG